MSTLLSKNELYREQEGVASSHIHALLSSGLALNAAGASVAVSTFPSFIVAIPVADLTQNINWTLPECKLAILNSYFVKNGNVGGVGDALSLVHVAARTAASTTITSYTIDTSAAYQVINATSNFPIVFSTGDTIRVSSAAATDCGGILHLIVGLA